MFYQAIIENNDDPLKLGRCQVRIIGIHTTNRKNSNANEYLPVEDLPWAEIAFPANCSALSQVSSFDVPENGSFVWLFFKDKELQYPVFFAVSPRIPKEKPDYEEGFSDPDKVYPKDESLNESPISRLARNEKISNTIVQTKKDTHSEWSVIGAQKVEPETPYDATYTKNRVLETRSGHVLEFDDTEGKERVHVYHRSGTFKEVHPSGLEVNKTVDHKFTIVLKDNEILIEGSEHTKINIDKNIEIGQNKNLIIGQNYNENVGVDKIMNVGRDSYTSVGRHGGVSCSGGYNISVQGNCNIDVVGNTRIQSNRIDLNPGS